MVYAATLGASVTPGVGEGVGVFVVLGEGEADFNFTTGAAVLITGFGVVVGVVDGEDEACGEGEGVVLPLGEGEEVVVTGEAVAAGGSEAEATGVGLSA